MLSLLLVLAIADSSVVIAPVRTQIVSGRLDLARACSSGAWIYGCTKFLGEKLSCTCVLERDQWRINATAQFIPYMYLWQPSWIPHENLHIDDIRTSAKKYLEELQSARYSSAADCSRSAEVESAGFTKRMDDWKKISNLERHPGLTRR